MSNIYQICEDILYQFYIFESHYEDIYTFLTEENYGLEYFYEYERQHNIKINNIMLAKSIMLNILLTSNILLNQYKDKHGLDFDDDEWILNLENSQKIFENKKYLEEILNDYFDYTCLPFTIKKETIDFITNSNKLKKLLKLNPHFMFKIIEQRTFKYDNLDIFFDDLYSLYELSKEKCENNKLSEYEQYEYLEMMRDLEDEINYVEETDNEKQSIFESLSPEQIESHFDKIKKNKNRDKMLQECFLINLYSHCNNDSENTIDYISNIIAWSYLFKIANNIDDTLVKLVEKEPKEKILHQYLNIPSVFKMITQDLYYDLISFDLQRKKELDEGISNHQEKLPYVLKYIN